MTIDTQAATNAVVTQLPTTAAPRLPAALLVDLVSDDEAAPQLGVTASTMARWRRAGYGPRFVKIGRRVFYRIDTIRAWAANCEFNSTAEVHVKRKAAGGRA